VQSFRLRIKGGSCTRTEYRAGPSGAAPCALQNKALIKKSGEADVAQQEVEVVKKTHRGTQILMVAQLFRRISKLQRSCETLEERVKAQEGKGDPHI